MLTLLFSILVSAGSVYACMVNDVGQGLTITAGIVGFFLAMILAGRLVAKKIGVVQADLQTAMEKGRNRINRDIQKFQTKPGGNPKVMQMQIEKKQKQMIQDALELVDRFAPYKKWNLLMGRQINTMKLQFYYQLEEFDKVDELYATRGFFSKPLLSEPLAVGMKMARQYKTDDIPGAEKTFKKHIRWFRGNRGSLLYALMSWIHVKNKDYDEARAILIKGKDKTGNEILEKNWELLSNGKEKKFSNKAFGEEWYALGLENPPAAKAKRMRGNAKGPQMY